MPKQKEDAPAETVENPDPSVEKATPEVLAETDGDSVAPASSPLTTVKPEQKTPATPSELPAQAEERALMNNPPPPADAPATDDKRGTNPDEPTGPLPRWFDTSVAPSDADNAPAPEENGGMTHHVNGQAGDQYTEPVNLLGSPEETPKGDPMPGLTLGRVVHYVEMQDDMEGVKSGIRAATVSDIYDDSTGEIGLTVQHPKSHNQPVIYATSTYEEYDEYGNSQGTWHWIPRA